MDMSVSIFFCNFSNLGKILGCKISSYNCKTK